MVSLSAWIESKCGLVGGSQSKCGPIGGSLSISMSCDGGSCW